MALGNAGAPWDSGPRHGQLRPCNAECPLSFRHGVLERPLQLSVQPLILRSDKKLLAEKCRRIR
jgi:hypothetical protein